MTDIQGSNVHLWKYRFSEPPEDKEIGVGDFDSDPSAEVHARELSKSENVPVIIKRYGLVDWEYVTEVDERS